MWQKLGILDSKNITNLIHHFFFSLIFLLCFASNSFGTGYTCPAYKEYTSCKTGYYLSGTSCNACTGVSFTETGTDTETITGGTRSRSKSRKCYRTGGAGGTNGSNACTGSTNCGAWSYGSWTYSCSSGYTATSSGCSCNTYCNAVKNTTSTMSGVESCNTANGSGSRSYTNRCSGTYTSSGCYSAGATCTGCSVYGTRVATGTCYADSCDEGYNMTSYGNCAESCYVAKVLRAGDTVVVPLYLEPQSKPYIVIDFDGNLCYGNLEPGPEQTALNVELDGEIYHSVD